MFQLEPPSRHHPPNLGTIPHPVSAARMRPRQTPQTRCLSDLDDGIRHPTRIPNVMYKIGTLHFFRSQTAHQMIWARGFFPPATATQTLLWSGRPISSHVAASKVRHQSLAGTSLTGQLVFLTKVYFFDASGVDVWIENVRGGECLRIRERRQVKVGHVAIGISDQVKDSGVSVTKTEIKSYFTKPTRTKLKLSSLTKVSGKAFTLETLDRKSVAFDQEITESCVWLCCVPAPDRCQRWRWRVRDGRLELREWDLFFLHCCCLHSSCLWLWRKKGQPPVSVNFYFNSLRWERWSWCNFKTDFIFLALICPIFRYCF